MRKSSRRLKVPSSRALLFLSTTLSTISFLPALSFSSTILYASFPGYFWSFLFLSYCYLSLFKVNDAVNASPRFIRSSLYNVPTTSDVCKQIRIPLGIVSTPMATLLNGEPRTYINFLSFF